MSTTSKGARPRVPQLSNSDEWNQPRCWSEPSRYITVSGPPSTVRRALRSSRTSSVKAWVEPESNHTSRISSTLSYSAGSWPKGARNRATAPSANHASAPSRSNASATAALTRSSFKRSFVPFFTNTAIGTPQARWRDTTQSGRFSIMPAMRFSPVGGTHFTVLIAVSARWRRVSPGGASLRGHITVPSAPPAPSPACIPSPTGEVQREAIGLSMAMNHCGVLRNSSGAFERQECGYWCLQASAGHERPGLDQFSDHRLVGAPVPALVVEHALAREQRDVRIVRRILRNRVRHLRRAAGRERLAVLDEGGVVVRAVARGGVDEAGARVVGDVIGREASARRSPNSPPRPRRRGTDARSARSSRAARLLRAHTR